MPSLGRFAPFRFRLRQKLYAEIGVATFGIASDYSRVEIVTFLYRDCVSKSENGLPVLVYCDAIFE